MGNDKNTNELLAAIGELGIRIRKAKNAGIRPRVMTDEQKQEEARGGALRDFHRSTIIEVSWLGGYALGMGRIDLAQTCLDVLEMLHVVSDNEFVD